MSAALAFLLSPLGRWIGGALAILAVLGAAWGYVHHVEARIAELAQKAASEHASAVQSQGQSAAQSDAAHIVDLGHAKADVTVHIQQENRDALLSSPGAQAGVDPQLYGALISGLCRYASAASDPRCTGLPKPDSAVVPPTPSSPAASGSYGWGDRGRSGLGVGPT